MKPEKKKVDEFKKEFQTSNYSANEYMKWKRSGSAAVPAMHLNRSRYRGEMLCSPCPYLLLTQLPTCMQHTDTLSHISFQTSTKRFLSRILKHFSGWIEPKWFLIFILELAKGARKAELKLSKYDEMIWYILNTVRRVTTLYVLYYWVWYYNLLPCRRER